MRRGRSVAGVGSGSDSGNVTIGIRRSPAKRGKWVEVSADGGGGSFAGYESPSDVSGGIARPGDRPSPSSAMSFPPPPRGIFRATSFLRRIR